MLPGCRSEDMIYSVIPDIRPTVLRTSHCRLIVNPVRDRVSNLDHALNLMLFWTAGCDQIGLKACKRRGGSAESERRAMSRCVTFKQGISTFSRRAVALAALGLARATSAVLACRTSSLSQRQAIQWLHDG